MWQVITEHYKDEKPIPLTMCFGVPPAATLIAGGGFDYVVLPRGGDELGAAGAVQGFPMRLVKALTAASREGLAATVWSQVAAAEGSVFAQRFIRLAKS